MPSPCIPLPKGEGNIKLSPIAPSPFGRTGVKAIKFMPPQSWHDFAVPKNSEAVSSCRSFVTPDSDPGSSLDSAYAGMTTGATPILREIASGLRPRNDSIDLPRNAFL